MSMLSHTGAFNYNLNLDQIASNQTDELTKSINEFIIIRMLSYSQLRLIIYNVPGVN